jgi:large subunit ribosomal protein L4
MIEAAKYTAQGDKSGTVELPSSVFELEKQPGNPEALMYEVIKQYLANQRQGTSSVKSRHEVQGSSRKIFRQKGTGNARQGTIRTPVRVGGGRAFGPRPKDWHQPIPRKKKRIALKLALGQRAKDGQVSVIESFLFEKPSSRQARNILEKISPEYGRKLILIDGSDPVVIKSFSNLPGVELDRADSVHPYEVLKCKHLILTQDALKKVAEVFGK